MYIGDPSKFVFERLVQSSKVGVKVSFALQTYFLM